MDPVVVNGKRVGFRIFFLVVLVVDVMITDPTALHTLKVWARLLRELESAKRDKQVLNGATVGSPGDDRPSEM